MFVYKLEFGKHFIVKIRNPVFDCIKRHCVRVRNSTNKSYETNSRLGENMCQKYDR
jgi:hypothetical protein